MSAYDKDFRFEGAIKRWATRRSHWERGLTLTLAELTQLKAAIDRFNSYTMRLSGKHLKSALITASWDNNDDVMPCTVAYYEKLCKYMNFTDHGMVLGLGCGTSEMTKRSRFMNEAYELGRSLPMER